MKHAGVGFVKCSPRKPTIARLAGYPIDYVTLRDAGSKSWFPDGPPPIHSYGVTQNGNGLRRRSSDKDDKHHFHDPDPLIEEILNEDYEQEMAAVASTMCAVNPSTLDTIVRKCLCRPKHHLENHTLKRERTLLLALSTVPYCNASTSQWSLLRAFYSAVATFALDDPSLASECPRKGNHWQIVGFQGSDPATDFRGTGILSLIQLYSSVKSLPESKLATIVQLSRNEPNDFPLAVVGINITSMLVTRLRNGDLLE
ncbi:hypothetical protein Y032_0094g2740 [Ancylostoma ceylanicum]|uniref:ELMO domain-containing protein n=1 Tax=Ancylostoma ceylanicum TaxID=53326 RepID=A0A016TL81_9BILA|nr:hypothetical protein Y032_0094g2740 [Ancylostoma ceylanicum]